MTAITPEEQDVLQRASLAAQVERQQPTPSFHNAEFIRALTANPQPASVIQILAVELYVGGLVVHYQYDHPVDVTSAVPLSVYAQAGVKPPIDRLLATAKAAGGNLAPSVAVTDDINTSYHQVGTEGAGLHVMHRSERFTPGVPDTATQLRITTYAGKVSLDLDSTLQLK